AGGAVPEAATGVDVLAPCLVPDDGALAAGDDHLGVLHDRHVGERMPEPGHPADDTSASKSGRPEPGTSASGCHRTPMQNRAPSSSSPSIVPSCACAVADKPSPTSPIPWWWWERTCGRSPTISRRREPSTVTTSCAPQL